MTIAVTEEPAAKPRELPVGAIVVGAWALMTLIVVQQSLPMLIAGPADADVLVRLTQVRDLMAGQAWFDTTQHRMGVPEGVPMHWSRLVDVPIVALIRLGELAFDRAGAEMFAMTAWPALLGLGLMWAVVAIGVRVAGRDAALPAAALVLFAIHARYLFSAGNIDHHNVQLVLSLVALAFVARLDEGRMAGACAGLAAATTLAVGVETLPMVALVGGAAALAATIDPTRFGRGAGALGAMFALATLVFFWTTVPPARPGTLVCDFLSAPYLAAALIGGGGLAILATGVFPRVGMVPRLGALAGLGGVALAAVAMIAPRCLAGPYAELDPQLVKRWLDTVDEAKSLMTLFEDDAAKAISILGAPLVGLVAATIAVRRAPADDRFAWCVLLGASVLTLAIMATQIRGGAFAGAVALPMGAWLIARARAFVATGPGAAAQIALVAAWLAPQALVYEGIGRGLTAAGLLSPAIPPMSLETTPGPATTEASPTAGATACFARDAFGALAALPTGRVMAPSNLGPPILAYTAHGALAGPYHRDARGILASMDAFEGTSADARRIARERGLGYVAICLSDSMVAAAIARNPTGFAASLTRGTAPDWLTPVVTAGAIRVWRVD